ncbi:PRD domain-containing protein [Lactobacillus sp. ESL0701]|nr:PRD domain-containing protein [Lactobacillus sp. ESL0701]
MSRGTINKYLKEIADEVEKYHVKLIRKRSYGIYFEGDTDYLFSSLQKGNLISSQENPKEIRLGIISELLTDEQPITIQELSDKYYVSRTTIELYLKEVKSWFNQQGASLKSGEHGIFIQASESTKRKLMTLLLGFYWGDNLSINGQVNSEMVINVPKELKSIFDQAIFSGVGQTLTQFQKNSLITLNDYQFQSLEIHLVIAIQRIKNGEIIQQNDNFTAHSMSPNTQILTRLLEEKFQLIIPEAEQRYINIHILAAEPNSRKYSNLKNNVTDSQNNVIDSFLRNKLSSYDETLINNLTLHLIPALHRFTLGLSIKNPYKDSIKRNFAYVYNKAVDLSIEIEKFFSVHVNDDEIAYIALHLESYIERREQNNKVIAVIACSTGLGTARLLKQRIEKYFPDTIKINRVVSISELMNTPVTEDLVISTVDINIAHKKVVFVPPFLDEQSKGKIQQVIDNLTKFKKDENEFMKLVRPELIMIDHQHIKRNQAIHKICDVLQKQDYVFPGIEKAAIKREELASTKMELVAMPHAPIKYVKSSCIAIYINSSGVDWGEGKVNLVFFMAMNKSVKSSINEIYSYFNAILEDKKMLRKLSRLTKETDVITTIGDEEID